MLKVLIVDDEAHTSETLSQMITLYCPGVEVAGMYASVKEGIEAIKLHKPDVALLDIEIGKESGFDILRHFPKPDFKVIFITAYQQYAVEAFRFAALDYLLKPVDPDILFEALNKASDQVDLEKIALKIDAFVHNMANRKREAKKIALKTASQIHVVNLPEIIYCKADHSYTTFYLLDNSTIVVSKTLGDFEDMLDDFDFLRIHQSYLVNINYMKSYDKGEGGNVILKNGTCLPVATRKKEQLLQYLSQL